MDYVQLISTFFAALAAIISFQTFRLAGKKRVAEMRSAWLHDLREKIASLFAETRKYESGNIDVVRVAYLMEYIDLMLDMSKEHHKDLKNALFPVALNAEAGNTSALVGDFDRLGTASRRFCLLEQQAIERGLERWI